MAILKLTIFNLSYNLVIVDWSLEAAERTKNFLSRALLVLFVSFLYGK